MLVDSHCHLNYKAFAQDQAEVIKRTQDRGMKVVCASSQLDTSRQAVEIAHKYDNVYAAVGYHPIHVEKHPLELDEFEKLAKDERVVAIGEIGLDYYHEPKDISWDKYKDKQKEAFRKMWQLAITVKKPVILHCRKAYDDLLQLIEELGSKDRPTGVIHCFEGNVETSEKFLKLGYYVGITGVVTFKNAGKLLEVAETVPLDKLLIETDAPYLSPEPHRGQRNEPTYVEFVAEKIAAIKGVDKEEVIAKTGQNAVNLFRL
ncbi:MAG: TatD family hydrolase [Patescibacteria group bacterium]